MESELEKEVPKKRIPLQVRQSSFYSRLGIRMHAQLHGKEAILGAKSQTMMSNDRSLRTKMPSTLFGGDV